MSKTEVQFTKEDIAFANSFARTVEAMNLTEEQQEVVKVQAAIQRITAQSVGEAVARGLNNMPWKEQTKFHLKGAAATLGLTVVAAVGAGIIASRLSRAANPEEASHTDADPFSSTASVEATSRPTSLKAAR